MRGFARLPHLSYNGKEDVLYCKWSPQRKGDARRERRKKVFKELCDYVADAGRPPSCETPLFKKVKNVFDTTPFNVLGMALVGKLGEGYSEILAQRVKEKQEARKR